jgi:hypothetical protein
MGVLRTAVLCLVNNNWQNEKINDDLNASLSDYFYPKFLGLEYLIQ